MFPVFTESVLYNQWSNQDSQGYFPQIRMGLSGCMSFFFFLGGGGVRSVNSNIFLPPILLKKISELK